MLFRDYIKRYSSHFFMALAMIFALASIFVPSASYDTVGMAKHVGKKVGERFAQLDRFSAQLFSSPAEDDQWPELKDFPSDMVIYRYKADSLHSWYNRFSVIPSLEDIPDLPAYRNYGQRWYVVKQLQHGDEKIIEGLLVRDGRNMRVDDKGQNGINSRIHLHGKYDIHPMDSQDEGAVVRIGSIPIFKVVISSGQSDSNPLTAAGLRWLALLLVLLACFCYLAGNRDAVTCLYALLTIGAVSALGQIWGTRMADYSQIFSPTLYAQDGLLNSFGSLLIINAFLFLAVLAMFMCRNSLADFFFKNRHGSLYLSILALMTAGLLAYIPYTLYSVIMNSGITMELYRINIVNMYTLLAYLSYAFLVCTILLLGEIFLTYYNLRHGKEYTVLRSRHVLVFSAVASAVILSMIMVLGFKKEQSRVEGWSNRLAMDRDLGVEMALREVEDSIQTDEVLSLMCYTENVEHIVARRLEETFFDKLPQPCALSVKVTREFNQDLRLYMEGLVSEGVAVGPRSHFIYNRNSAKGSFYTGVFSYYSKEMGVASIIIELVPRFSQSVVMPPTYSYAKYEDGRLNGFNGNFAYPTVLEGLIGPEKEKKSSFVTKGYRHFVNKISDEETIVISRREERFMSYFITFTYLLFLLCIICNLFHRRNRMDKLTQSFFSRRMMILVVTSLTITLVVMAGLSVYFVYQRNERNLNNIMSGKISTIQIMLDAACRQVNGPESLLSPEFMRVLEEVSRNTNTLIDLYSPSGHLLVSNTGRGANFGMRRRGEINSLISSDAYRSICLDHQRYYIEKIERQRYNNYMLYAPVINAMGKTVAITASPYNQRDYDFMRDAVIHAATVISLFIILLFITILVTSSIVKRIFHPLVQMGEKMTQTDAQNLETIDYQGNDEISALVVSYNTMVRELRESTGKLAAAERDKAWSEMARQVAHEIKNPLTPIKLEIQRLQRLKSRNTPDWEDKFDSVSSVILEHIDILSQTANEFSTFAKLYSEPSTQINLDKVLKEQIMLFSNRDVPITYLGEENTMIMGPKPQLIRVFVNLLSNALQAVEGMENPKLMVSLRRSSADGMWDIVFEDNGPGVSEENQSKLFTPNFTTKSSGTGLGLAICRSIVDRCGGRISYSRSFSLGGACFTVTLPAMAE